MKKYNNDFIEYYNYHAKEMSENEVVGVEPSHDFIFGDLDEPEENDSDTTDPPPSDEKVEFCPDDVRKWNGLVDIWIGQLTKQAEMIKDSCIPNPLTITTDIIERQKSDIEKFKRDPHKDCPFESFSETVNQGTQIWKGYEQNNLDLFKSKCCTFASVEQTLDVDFEEYLNKRAGEYHTSWIVEIHRSAEEQVEDSSYTLGIDHDQKPEFERLAGTFLNNYLEKIRTDLASLTPECTQNSPEFMQKFEEKVINFENQLNSSFLNEFYKLDVDTNEPSQGPTRGENLGEALRRAAIDSRSRGTWLAYIGGAAISIGLFTLGFSLKVAKAAASTATTPTGAPLAVSASGFALIGGSLFVTGLVAEGFAIQNFIDADNQDARANFYKQIEEKLNRGEIDLIIKENEHLIHQSIQERINSELDRIISLPPELQDAAFDKLEKFDITRITQEVMVSIILNQSTLILDAMEIFGIQNRPRDIDIDGPEDRNSFVSRAAISVGGNYHPIALESVDCIGKQCEAFPRLRYRVRVIQPGRSLNNYEYSPQMLQRSARLLEGVPVQAYGFGQYQPMFSHLPAELEPMQPSGFALNRVGLLKEAAYENHPDFGEGLFATLVVDKAAEGWAKAILDEATTPGGNGTGVSIFADIDGDYGYDDHNDDMYVKVNNIQRFRSVDLASQPAAGGAIVAAIEDAGSKQRAHLNALKAAIKSLTIEEIITARQGYAH